MSACDNAAMTAEHIHKYWTGLVRELKPDGTCKVCSRSECRHRLAAKVLALPREAIAAKADAVAAEYNTQMERYVL